MNPVHQSFRFFLLFEIFRVRSEVSLAQIVWEGKSENEILEFPWKMTLEDFVGDPLPLFKMAICLRVQKG